ncbi:hypothetical protein DFH06DRAFT_1130297 [Mycena polygramma]|nr:hypothetical protein DFH06DRAFT_1130297 [Mycena polygramma]
MPLDVMHCSTPLRQLRLLASVRLACMGPTPEPTPLLTQLELFPGLDIMLELCTELAQSYPLASALIQLALQSTYTGFSIDVMLFALAPVFHCDSHRQTPLLRAIKAPAGSAVVQRSPDVRSLQYGGPSIGVWGVTASARKGLIDDHAELRLALLSAVALQVSQRLFRMEVPRSTLAHFVSDDSKPSSVVLSSRVSVWCALIAISMQDPIPHFTLRRLFEKPQALILK